jgi:glutathione S-transferase
MLTLYWARNTCALATHIALEDAGAIYEARRVDFARAEQRSPEYLAINPKGRVPALVTPQGVLTETPALLVYVAQTHSHAGLVDVSDPFVFAQAQAFAAYLCATVHVMHAHDPRGARWADEPSSLADMKQKSHGNMRDCFELIERDLFKGPWALGDAYSVIDPYLFTLSGWLAGHGVDVGAFAKVGAHFQRMSERASVRRVLAAEAT